MVCVLYIKLEFGNLVMSNQKIAYFFSFDKLIFYAFVYVNMGIKTPQLIINGTEENVENSHVIKE